MLFQYNISGWQLVSEVFFVVLVLVLALVTTTIGNLSSRNESFPK